jgi:acyl-CoA reductase-like NAD-dependent aldehyde dehydrogenase
VALCGAEDVDDAVAAARRAFEDGRWRLQHPRQRRRVLQRLARLVEEHRDELALVESLDMGQPVSDALAVDLRVTVQTLDFFAEAVDKSYDEVAPTDHRTLATITREPIGVVGAVVPWNFPLMLAAWKLGPALATGNSVVLKPAEQSPLTALRLAELAAEAGLPDGVLNVVPGDGPGTGAAIGLHPDVDAVTFTGSGPVGRQFLRYAADSNLKQVSLELGGKNPQIVMADAPDTEVVAKAVATGIFFNAGEVCSAGSRLLVHRSRHDELVDAEVRAAQALQPSDPLDPATRLGALVEEPHLHRVMGFVRNAVDDGAQVLAGGRRAREDSGGYYVEATVLGDVTPQMEVVREEVFGPVLAVLPFDTVEEAVQLANDTRYGLAAAVWSRDISTAHLTARAIRAGTVWVNCFDESDVTVPFGGYKESGIGRDKSLHALEKYTQLKTTWVQL